MTLPHPYPAGWYRFRYSHELGQGEVVADRYFGKQLVCFRTLSGAAHVIDAYCAHLGDGHVAGETIQCPFHGWRYDGAGRCTRVPYASSIPSRASIHSYPVVERCGVIFFYHDTTGAPPGFEVPDLEELHSPEWVQRTVHTRTIRSQIQEPRENALDVAHLPVLHRTTFPAAGDRLPVIDAWDEDVERKRLSFDLHITPADAAYPSQGRLRFSLAGPGHMVMRMERPIPLIFVVPLTPVDEQHVVFSHTIWVKKTRMSLLSSLLERMAARRFLTGLNEDIVLFEKKIYRMDPVLSSADGPILQFRRWMQQFEPAPGQNGAARH